MIAAARGALIVSVTILAILHPSIALSFVWNGLEEDSIISYAGSGNEFKAKADRLNVVRVINIRPIDMSPNYRDPLFIFCFDCVIDWQCDCISLSPFGPTIVFGMSSILSNGLEKSVLFGTSGSKYFTDVHPPNRPVLVAPQLWNLG
jgi:hypothetical protein